MPSLVARLPMPSTLTRRAAAMSPSRVDSPMIRHSDASSSSNLTDIAELEERLDKLATPPPDFTHLFTETPILGTFNPLFDKSKSRPQSPETYKLPWYEDLLRYAAQSTVQEMVDEIKAANPQSTVMNKRISNRLLDALSSVAASRGVDREGVKSAFEKAKRESGVTKRQYAVIHSKTKAFNQRRRDGKVRVKDEEEDEVMVKQEEGEDEEETLSVIEEAEIDEDETLSADEEMEDVAEVKVSEEEEAATILMQLSRESQAILVGARMLQVA